MRSRWQFNFEAKEPHFKKVHRYRGEFSPIAKTPISKQIEFEATIEPEDLNPPTGMRQRGCLYVTLRGRPDETENAAYFLASSIEDRVNFAGGNLNLETGFISAERIPETPEEAEAIGDEVHWVKLHLIETDGTAPFDSGKFVRLRIPTEHAILLRQFNAANKIDSSADRFLGMFKVIEKRFALGRKDLLHALQANEDLIGLIQAELRDEASGDRLARERVMALLRSLVRLRDNCAHMRGRTGYDPQDRRQRAEMESQLPLVECLARRSIEALANEGGSTNPAEA